MIRGFHVWTEHRVDALKAYRAKGLSASEIASRLGWVTRNAVIGKLHRLGLTTVSEKKSKKRQLSPKEAGRDQEPVRRIRDRLAALPLEPLPKEDAPPARLFKLQDLEKHNCRWPYGDPKSAAFGFCGCQIVEGTSYCSQHVRRAYVLRSPERPKLPETVNRETGKVFA